MFLERQLKVEDLYPPKLALINFAFLKKASQLLNTCRSLQAHRKLCHPLSPNVTLIFSVLVTHHFLPLGDPLHPSIFLRTQLFLFSVRLFITEKKQQGQRLQDKQETHLPKITNPRKDHEKRWDWALPMLQSPKHDSTAELSNTASKCSRISPGLHWQIQFCLTTEHRQSPEPCALPICRVHLCFTL